MTAVAVTSTDVAREAGVSQATVSRVLSGSDKVSAATRQRVLAAMERLGYSPNLVARAMKTRRTDTIGVLVSQITNPFYPQALQAVGRALAAHGKRMVLWDTEVTGEAAALDAIRQGLVDGVLFTTGTTETPSLREAVQAQRPVVLLNRSVPDLPGDQVTSDNFAGATAVAEHLVDLGHRRIGLIGGPPLPSTVTERRQSFRETLTRLEVALDDQLCRYGPLSYDEGAAAMSDLLSVGDRQTGEGSRPTAVFCVNDITALGAVDAARSVGLRVPEDISVVGYDDIQQASWGAFRLTTVNQPIDAMAVRAVELLLARIDDPQRPPEHERFPARLIVRETTAPPPREEITR